MDNERWQLLDSQLYYFNMMGKAADNGPRLQGLAPRRRWFTVLHA
jgi:hypothetical protein